MKKFAWKNILIILIIMILAIAVIPKFCQNDFFFDLKTGESILKHGVDFKDHFSFIPNLLYMYHHFLYDLILYFIHYFAGMSGVLLFFIFIFTLLGITVYFINLKYTKNKIISLLISLFTLWICQGYASNRVQTVTYLLFFLEIYLINQLYITGNKKYSIYLILISILIANMHMPMWILTIIFFLPYIFEMIIKYLVDKYKKIGELISKKFVIDYPKNSKLLILTFIILIFTGLLTPLKFYPYTFFIKALGNNSFTFIFEMEKTVLIDDFYELLLVVAMLIIVFILNTKIKLRDLVLLLGCFILSLMAGRNIAYVYLIYPTILVKIYCESYKIPYFKFNIWKCINKKVITIFSIFVLVLLYCFCFYKLDLRSFDYGISLDYPDKSVKYIKENLDYNNIRLYNEFNYGSYLEYYDIPVFIDSRAEVYIAEFNGGKDIVSDFLKAQEFGQYREVFEKYNFNYALIYRNSPLYNYLMVDEDCDLIYEEDERYSLFECKL